MLHMNSHAMTGDRSDEQFRKLFVGGLHIETTNESLKAFYEQWGLIVDCIVMRDMTTQKSRGFGFVTFQSADDLDECMKSRPHIIDKKQVEAKRATPKEESGKPEAHVTSKKLFVGGLRPDIDESHLQEYFGQHGNIEKVSVVVDKETQKKRGFAFIEFDDNDPVDKLILTKYHMVNGCRVEVRKAVDKAVLGGNTNGVGRGRGQGMAGGGPGGPGFQGGPNNWNQQPGMQGGGGGGQNWNQGGGWNQSGPGQNWNQAGGWNQPAPGQNWNQGGGGGGWNQGGGNWNQGQPQQGNWNQPGPQQGGWNQGQQQGGNWNQGGGAPTGGNWNQGGGWNQGQQSGGWNQGGGGGAGGNWNQGQQGWGQQGGGGGNWNQQQSGPPGNWNAGGAPQNNFGGGYSGAQGGGAMKNNMTQRAPGPYGSGYGNAGAGAGRGRGAPR